jgi:RND family efflux transporter MFP subunit
MRRLLLLLLPFVAACGSDPEPLPPPVVRVAVVGTGMSSERSFTGTTQAASESRVAFQVGGTMVRRSADIGDRVRAGQVLAELDPSDIALQRQQARAGLAQAEAGLRQAQAGARLAQAEYDRIRALYTDDLIALSAYDGARTGRDTSAEAVRQAQSGVEAARDGVALADRALGYTRLVAPAAGSVGDVYAEPGELVAPGQPVVLIASDSAPMEVRFDASEGAVGSLASGQRVRVTLSALEGTFNGTIAQVGTAAARGGTTYPVTVRLENADARVRSGMTARVTLKGEGNDDGPRRLVVPAAAVDRDEQGTYVLVVSGQASGALMDSARVERRAVETGHLLPGGVEVTSGLSSGERVVAAGLSDVLPGQRVRIARNDALRESASRF